MHAPMAVSADSAHPEGAYAFLKSMLDEKTQTAYTDRFPSTRAAFESHLAEAMREPTAEEGYTVTYITADGFRFRDGTVYLWDEAEGERAPRAVLLWYDENYSVIREEKLYAMSEAQRDSLMALLDSALRSTSYDQVIAGIVHEEAGAYFAGQRGAEEVSSAQFHRLWFSLSPPIVPNRPARRNGDSAYCRKIGDCRKQHSRQPQIWRWQAYSLFVLTFVWPSCRWFTSSFAAFLKALAIRPLPIRPVKDFLTASMLSLTMSAKISAAVSVTKRRGGR